MSALGALELQLDFSNRTDYQVSSAQLHAHLLSVLRRLDLVDTVSIELLIVNDEEIRALNKTHLQHDYPTDVLSFPADSTPNQAGFLGSIVIAAPTAEQQAHQGGIAFDKELSLLAGHGLLHLLGYHHH